LLINWRLFEMSISQGKIEYQLGTHPTTGCGFSYSDDELD